MLCERRKGVIVFAVFFPIKNRHRYGDLIKIVKFHAWLTVVVRDGEVSKMSTYAISHFVLLKVEGRSCQTCNNGDRTRPSEVDVNK